MSSTLETSSSLAASKTGAIPTAVIINNNKNNNNINNNNNNVNNNGIPTIEATALYCEPIPTIHGQELRQDVGTCRGTLSYYSYYCKYYYYCYYYYITITITITITILSGCGRTFQRPVGVHDAMAQYYRCKECCKLRLTDFCIIC